MRNIIKTTALILAIATGFGAHQAKASDMDDLSAPIIRLTKTIAKNADTLDLTAEQRADLKTWLENKPANRKAVEADARGKRAQLRAAILDNAPRADRQALAQEIGVLETRLVMMRSDCVDHWRATLTEDQFAKALELAGH
jgi:Spy/CpxP family protein refolding chaperone